MKNEIVVSETFDVIELDDSMLNVVVGGLASLVDGEYTNTECVINKGCNTVSGCGGTKPPA